MRMHTLRTAALLTSLASAGFADVITGQVVDDGGLAVAGVNLNAVDLDTGDAVTLFNDGTDINGNFTTTIPAGRFEITFVPPPPPTTNHLIGTIPEVLVAGTVNLGVVTLRPGVTLSGRVVDSLALPHAGVNLDVVELATGDSLALVGDQTDALGNFAIAVPAGQLELTFDGRNAAPGPLAPSRTTITLSGSIDLGDVVLDHGFFVSGFVIDNLAVGVRDVDLDFVDVVSGLKILSLGDNTDKFGAFSVVVPAGDYEVEFCPMFDDELVAKSVPQTVAGNASMGIVMLSAGVILSGNVTDYNGAIQVHADVDVRVAASGAPVLTCMDNTDSNGDYAVVVPNGTLRVTFRPPPLATGLGPDVHPSLVVSGDTALDGVLPQLCLGSNYGAGLAGSGGLVPSLTELGAPIASNPMYAWELTNGIGGGLAILIAGTAPASLPIAGGTLLVSIAPGSFAKFTLLLGGASGTPGAGAVSVSIPTLLLAGFTVYGQYAVVDPGASKGWAMSDGFSAYFCP